MSLPEELIQKFFQDKCNAEEAEQVIRYLDAHPEIIDQYLSEEDWEQEDNSRRLHPAISQKMLAQIRSARYQQQGKRKWVQYMAAASVLLAVALGVMYFFNSTNTEQPTAAVQVNDSNTTPILTLASNTTDKPLEIVLKDGSVVVLGAHAELNYYLPFESDKRRLYLKGEALFKVAKDKTKPFTVFTGDIGTTALGTEFKVSAVEKSNTITVKLYEGKVVIKQTGSNVKKWNKDFYLLPGDEFSYNRLTFLAEVTGREKQKNTSTQSKTATGAQDDATNWYMFNNQELAQVLDQLSAVYKVKIVYSADEVRNMTFIGKIEKTDSVQNILRDIALLNDLVLTKQGNAFILRKK